MPNNYLLLKQHCSHFFNPCSMAASTLQGLNASFGLGGRKQDKFSPVLQSMLPSTAAMVRSWLLQKCRSGKYLDFKLALHLKILSIQLLGWIEKILKVLFTVLVFDGLNSARSVAVVWQPVLFQWPDLHWGAPEHCTFQPRKSLRRYPKNAGIQSHIWESHYTWGRG